MVSLQNFGLGERDWPTPLTLTLGLASYRTLSYVFGTAIISQAFYVNDSVIKQLVLASYRTLSYVFVMAII